MFGKFGPKVAAIKSGEPELVGFYFSVRAADHFKFQVGDNVFERQWGMLKKILVTLSAGFFAAKKDEEHGAFGSFAVRQGASQLQHGNTAGSVVVSAVVNLVIIHGLADAQVVHVRGEKNYFIF